MAENRIHIQHLHSTTATTVPDAVKTDLFDGEIGLLIKDNNEKIFFRNDGDDIVTISTDAQNNNKFSVLGHTHSSLQFSPGSTKDFNTAVYTPSSSNSPTTGIVIPTNLSHLTNDIGTITAVTAGNGLTGGGTVSTGEKGVTLTVGAGTGIDVTTDAVGIDSVYQTKIANGETAYSWGDHKNGGYAKNTDLTTLKNSFTAHTGNTTVHITAAERTNWNNTKSRLDTFLSGATLSGEVIDTLTEIQSYITGDKADAANLLTSVTQNANNISLLATSVSTNTTNITNLSGNVSSHVVDFNNHKISKANSGTTYGHVKIVTGDLNGKTYANGEAAAAAHTHGQYLTSYSETYKGTVTGITAGTGLTGGGTKGTGATGFTLSHGDTSAVDTATTFGPTTNVTGTNNTTITIPNFKVDDFGHVISAGTITYTSKDTDTHHTGMTVVTNSTTGKTSVASITDGSVRLNHIENGSVRSTISLASDEFCDVKGTAANQITFSINTGTTSSTIARGDHSHSAYVNKNAFGNVKVGSTTIAAETTEDTLELVAGESILLTPDATNDKVTISLTSINCGTF
jgi:hypothetical protein